MKGQIKAVLFDMDGVLVEAKDWHYECLQQGARSVRHADFAKRTSFAV